MSAIIKPPKVLEKVIGPEGWDEFVDFLNQTLDDQKSNIIELVSDKFEKKVTEESGIIKLQIAQLKEEMHKEISINRIEIAELKADLKGDIAGIHKEIAGIHKEISNQTKWILAAILAAVALFPIMNKLIDKLF